MSWGIDEWGSQGEVKPIGPEAMHYDANGGIHRGKVRDEVPESP